LDWNLQDASRTGATAMRIIHLANRHHDEPSAGHGYWLNHAYKNSCIENGADFIIVAPVKSLDPEAFAVLKLDSESRARLTFFHSLDSKMICVRSKN
jgi:hypothetical protein